jgi:hypothetical protein
MALGGKQMTGAKNEHLQVLTSVPHEFEAEMIVGELQRHGIPATSTGGFVSNFKAEAPGNVRILVKQSDLEQAMELLDRVQDERDLRGGREEDDTPPEREDSLADSKEGPSAEVHRALVAAIIGLIFLPPMPNLYSMWLLLKHDLLAGDVHSVDWRAQAALLINVIVILLSIAFAVFLFL